MWSLLIPEAGRHSQGDPGAAPKNVLWSFVPQPVAVDGSNSVFGVVFCHLLISISVEPETTHKWGYFDQFAKCLVFEQLNLFLFQKKKKKSGPNYPGECDQGAFSHNLLGGHPASAPTLNTPDRTGFELGQLSSLYSSPQKC